MCFHMLLYMFQVACVIRVPMEVVKQRMQAQMYQSSMQVVQVTLRQEGFRGLYRGYTSTVIREVPFSIIQFPLWELFKKWWSHHQGRLVDSWQSSLCGALAGKRKDCYACSFDLLFIR